MCGTCGCESNGPVIGGEVHHHHHHGEGSKTLVLEQNLLAHNDALAAENREFLEECGILALNLVSAPGSGKTSLLVRTLEECMGKLSMAVIEGDQETENDANRIRQTGCPVIQINTGTGCHLDAHMLRHAFERLELEVGSVLMIENVGNLVCPALFDLGEAAKVAILSVTEGEDKPLKYPHMFRAAEILLINKVDLLPYLDFDLELCVENARRINPDMRIIPVSARTGEGLAEWYAWLEQKVPTSSLA